MIFAPLNTTLSLAQRRPSIEAFEKFLGNVVKTPTQAYQFQETDAGYQLQLDVPGIAKDQLQIQIEENRVRIQSLPESSRRYEYHFEFPKALESAQCSAKLELGVLNLQLAVKKPNVVSNTLTIE